MSLFLIAAAALLLLAAALLLWHRVVQPRPADLDDHNLGWLQQRRTELSGEDNPKLVEELGLRVIEEREGNAVAPAATDRGSSSTRLGAMLLLLLVPLASVLYLRLGALEDVLIYRDLENLQPDDSAARQALAARVQERSAERPENLYYLDLLGQLQMSSNNLGQAADTFQRLAERAPEDARAQAQAAQARFVASGRRLDDEAQLLAERALALDPRDSRALGLLGMASFEAGQYTAAAEYWGRLQALEEPGSDAYRMLDDVLRLARERAGASGTVAGTMPEQGPSPTSAAADGDAGISVTLELPQAAAVDPASTVFVFARNPGAGGRMPIAVRRLRAADLPLTLRLTDSDSMAGQLLSEAGEVAVSAQVSRNGQPGMANALYSGSTGPVSAAAEGKPLQILLQPVTAP